MGKEESPTHVFLQWKGTDACFDFYCGCGWTGHVDGYFAYYVRCGKCRSIYKMPDVFKPEKMSPDFDTSRLEGAIAEPEGDDTD